MLRARGVRRSQSRPLPPKPTLRSFWRGSEPASGSPAPWLCAAAWEPLLPRYAPHDTKFRLDNLDSQSNYGIDVLVLLDGKEIFKNINVF